MVHWTDAGYRDEAFPPASYLVSTAPDGGKRWWERRQDIPANHTDVRASTEAETALMDEILATDVSEGEPSHFAAEKLQALWA